MCYQEALQENGCLDLLELQDASQHLSWKAASANEVTFACYLANKLDIQSEDCFYYCSERNNVVVLFGTLKVQSFILAEVSDCGLLIVVTSSTFLKRKDMLKEKNS